MRSRSVHSRRAVPIHRSAIAFARGARIGVLITRAPSEMNISSKTLVYLASRSRMRNLMRPALSGQLFDG
jgi:hypothetical protein